MGEEDRWEKVRAIVREECERIEKRILEVLEKHGQKPKLGFINGQWTGITQEQLSSWKIAYECDVDQELKKAAAWLTSNKQPKNYARFLNAWLNRCSERSLIRSIPTRSEPIVKKTCGYCPKASVGSVGGIEYCNDHSHDAMDRKPVKAA
jgi:hypothetical protein